MIAETFPEKYDAVGHRTSRPFERHRGLHSTFPMGRYFSRPLTTKCQNVEEIREFLKHCRAASDEKLFGKTDYWQPPDEFEKRKAGDCEDFSLWTWRQLLEIGFEARFVAGRHGRFGTGHAWVIFFQHDKCFLVEPQRRFLGEKMPRLSTLSYEPKFSVSWNGRDFKYYAHKSPDAKLPWRIALKLLPEWLIVWDGFG